MFLVASGLNYGVLGMLMGVSKGTIHNLFYGLAFIKKLILRIIISDGSGAIAKAIRDVFPDSNHQLCKFHKLKNLMDRIYKRYSTPNEKKENDKVG